MGRLMSSDFRRDSSRPDHCHRSGPCRTSFSFHPCEPCEHRNVHWRHGRPVGLVAPTNHPCCRYTPNAVRSLEHKLLGESRASTIRGELAIGRGSSRHNLVFGRSRGSLTMMQSCASAAKLRGGGPILQDGVKPWPVSGGRPLGSSTGTDQVLFVRLQKRVLLSRHAARKTTPAGASPVVTMRHNAISSFLARATIRVLRVPPRASAVRARYHCAGALSF